MTSKQKITPEILASKIEVLFQEAEPLLLRTLIQKKHYEDSIKEDMALLQKMSDPESLENSFFGHQRDEITKQIKSHQHDLKSLESAEDMQQKTLLDNVTKAVFNTKKDITIEAVYAHAGFIVDSFVDSLKDIINNSKITRRKTKKSTLG